MLSAKIRVVSDCSETVLSALGPESGRILPRTKVTLHNEDGNAVIDITASDTSAMRAALNSYLECIRITEDIGNITR
ncbi:MAG: KEOPS complex subunit Pcc1 [Candidatus Methanomethylophilaceae archaeon]|jgi:KEOPS complex subunit Pcc1